MAENEAKEQLEKRAPEPPEADPLAESSLSGPLLISMLLLMGTLAWALLDEVYFERPWKAYQRQFVDRFTTHLERVRPRQADAERRVKESPEYVELERKMLAEEEAVRPQVAQLDNRVASLDRQIAEITEPFQNERAWISAKIFELETTSGETAKARVREQIETRRQGSVRVNVLEEDGSVTRASMTFDDLEKMFNRLQDEKARIVADRIELIGPASEARRLRDAYLQDQLIGLTDQQVADLMRGLGQFTYDIKQIHVEEGDLVDRCESCHLGVRQPITLTAENMGGEKAFVSHPNPDLFRIHDPEQIGCSTCHGGNGRGTTSVEKGHGRYKHWLTPLFHRENVQAGCNQCHVEDRVTLGADVLNHGKDLFENRGCVGCHKYEGFDRESEALSIASQTIRQLEMERDSRFKEIRQAELSADEAETNEEARVFLDRAIAVSQMIAQINSRIDELNTQSKYLMQDRKKVGPNLKDIKAKLNGDWLPFWLEDPQAFRPGTKMPTFRLTRDENRSLAAFLWQAAIDTNLPSQPEGDYDRGQELFKNVGCLGCHSIDGQAIGMGDRRVGGDFAADLSRVGEKARFEYLVRWIYNPRARLAPYSPTLGRDLTPEDYTSRGLEYVFDEENSTSPIDGHELLVHNMTVMPNFRLTPGEARDIATFLFRQRRNGVQYPPADFLNDPSLAAQGERLARMYGCAGCHEIKGLEDEQRIGTELTVEGNKPIERLDFALLTYEAKRSISPFTGEKMDRRWYDHKGFFETKLSSPGVFDRGKERAPEEALRMPNIYLEDDEIAALTTFLLGSVESTLPHSVKYNAEGQKKYVQEGWWVIQKYNCAGCHNVLVGQDSVLMGLPMYQTPDGRDQLPPRLTTQGARVDPNWLLRFLRDPSMSGHAATGQENGLDPQVGANRNGVRPYLMARMPTFNFSPNELQALVNFFMAASSQQQPYIPERMEPLTPEERIFARTLFTSGTPCLQCHITGDPVHDLRATAPNFLLAAERLKPAWTERWLLDPQLISPGTGMPSGLFTRDEARNRWIFAGPIPPEVQRYEKDHVSLLVRYMFQITPEEQRLLVGRPTGGSAAGGQSARARHGGNPGNGLASSRPGVTPFRH